MAIIPRNLQQAQSLLSQGLTFVSGSGFTTSNTFGLTPPTPADAAPPPQLTQEAESTTTGIEPQQLQAILYGKDVPEFLGGKMRIGGRIIEGPFFGGTAEAPTVSYIASHAHCANPNGTRTITEFSLRGRPVWTSVDGVLDPSTFASDTFEFKTGTETQVPFDISTDRYGDSAIAYRSHILSRVKDLPLVPFAGIVPFPSVLVEDSTFGDADDGITRNDALETLLRYAGLDDDDFEVDVTGSDIAWILGQKTELIPFLQSLRKIFVNWNVTATDKLRIIEPRSFSIDATITRDNHIAQSMKFIRAEPLTKPREKIYRFVDIDRDYEPNAATARQELFPFPTTSSIESETIELPIVTEASQAMVDVNYALFQSEVARKRLDFTGMVSLLGLEAGDGIRFADHDHFRFRGRVTETVKNAADFSIDVRAETWLNCELPADDDFGEVVLLVHFEGEDGQTTFTDSSSYAHTLTAFGDAQVSTTQKKFGSGSLLGDGDGIQTPVAFAPEFALSDTNTSPYTIECWAWFASINRDQVLVTRHSGVSGLHFMLRQNSNDEIQLLTSSDSGSFTATVETSGANIAIETWYHIAADKDSTGKVRIYVNGTMYASDTPADSVIFGGGNTAVIIGTDGSRWFDGYIDEVRITKGISRYGAVYGDSGFTPPTAQFPDE